MSCNKYNQTECLNHETCGWCITDNICSWYNPCHNELPINNETCLEFILSDSTQNCREETIGIVVVTGLLFVITCVALCCAWKMLSNCLYRRCCEYDAV